MYICGCWHNNYNETEIDFTNKELTKQFLEQYKKHISNNLHPKNNTEFSTDDHLFHLWFDFNYSHMLFVDEEAEMISQYLEGLNNEDDTDNEDDIDDEDYIDDEDDVIDEYDVDKLFSNHKSFVVFDNYLYVDAGNIYINGIEIPNPLLENGYKYCFSCYNDYLILDSQHIANFEPIDNIIKPTREKLCKMFKVTNDELHKISINIDNINYRYGNINLYRGVPMVLFNCRKLDRFLIGNFDNNIFASLRISI